MRPEQGSGILKIPVTFEGGGGARVKQSGRKLWLFLICVIWLLGSIISLVVASTFTGYMFPIFFFIFLSYVTRYLVMREKFYRKKRRELIDNNFMFEHSVFWNIYDISQRYPYFVTYETGVKGLIVAFDKGVVIGKGEDSDFYHHEALADAYQQVLNRGLGMTHLDYMDVVGKDKRMVKLFDLAEKTVNPDIRKVLTRMYDHTEALMNSSYATYDVYIFTFSGREEQFWFEIEQCLPFFLRANYLRFTLMKRDDLSKLVETTMNVKEFSPSRANDSIFKKLNFNASYLKAIWVEQNGERKKLDNTREETEEARRIKTAEKKVRKKGSIVDRLRNKDNENVDVNLFEDGTTDNKKDTFNYNYNDNPNIEGVGFDKGYEEEEKKQRNQQRPNLEKKSELAVTKEVTSQKDEDEELDLFS